MGRGRTHRDSSLSNNSHQDPSESESCHQRFHGSAYGCAEPFRGRAAGESAAMRMGSGIPPVFADRGFGAGVVVAAVAPANANAARARASLQNCMVVLAGPYG